MKRICVPAMAGFMLAGSMVPGWAAGVSVKDAPNLGRPGINTKVSGSGFGANEAVDVYFDTTDLLLDVTDDTGSFGADGLKVPADAAPGGHWITAIGRHDGIAAHVLFTVRTNWMERGFDERGQRDNRSENTINAANVGRLDLDWAAETNGSVVSSAAYNGTIYVGSADGKLYAFSPTGTLKWSATTGGAILSSPAIANSNIYVGSSDGKLYAFKSANGAVAWSTAAGGPIVSSPVISNGVLYVGCAGDGKIYAFNATNGSPAWAAPAVTGGLDYSSPAVAKGNIYIGSLDGRVYAFNAATGGLTWSSAAAGGPIESSPAVANGRVFVGSADQKIYAFNAATGAPAWTSNVAVSVTSSPAVNNGTLYIGGTDGELLAVNANNGKNIWTGLVSGAIQYSSPAVAGDVVYVGSYDKSISAFPAAGCNGQVCTPLWSGLTGAAIDSSPTVADGMVIAGSTDKSLYVFTLDGGNAARHRDTRPPSYGSLHPDKRLKPVKHGALRE
ncbi:MAG TPA: PQQ-binding-like beta-propeller repeat protein [Rhizomicrobium sp.]|jgi:outer membrane protein assembly factor BamB|nr:PQQ-binding-like beta-propeller repeat protein [Rhizomicrobium sp.]